MLLFARQASPTYAKSRPIGSPSRCFSVSEDHVRTPPDSPQWPVQLSLSVRETSPKQLFGRSLHIQARPVAEAPYGIARASRSRPHRRSQGSVRLRVGSVLLAFDVHARNLPDDSHFPFMTWMSV